MQAQHTLAQAIASYKASSKLNYEELALQWSVGKTTLYRAAMGDWHKPTQKLQRIAKMVEVELTPKRYAIQCQPVLNVIDDVWDGTDEHAIQLARLIKEIHLLSIRYK